MTDPHAPRDFGFGPDEELLRDLARKLLDERMPVEKLRKLVASDFEATYERGERPGWDHELWGQIVQLGWTGLAVPEEAGGAGFRTVGVAALVEEVGRHALPSPLVATLGVTWALRCADPRVSKPWLGRIADGASATLAITDRDGTWDPGATGLAATADGDDLVLSGEACFVQDAFKADLLVASARLPGTAEGAADVSGEPDTLVLCVVPADAPGVQLQQDHIHDLTRDQATLRCEGVRVAADAVVSRDAAAALERAWPALLVLAAADLCGCAEWQLQATAEYARTRTQFDRPIGFFQAVKHPIVDAMIAIDRARSLLYHAACCIDFEPGKALLAARMAKSAASDAGAYVSDRSVQLHGGIGFTWESDVHLFFKRSMHGQALFGDAVHQRSRLADELIGPVRAAASGDG